MVELTGAEISDADFAQALIQLEKMSIEERAKRSKMLGGREARSYYARTASGDISLKLITRLAYRIAGREWKPGEGLQSKAVFQRFKVKHPLVHSPTKRALVQQEKEERQYVSRLRRDGQADFRAELIATNPVCVLSGCRSISALEAAHINPVSKRGKMSASNGILLRADLHRLFDLGYLAVNPETSAIVIHPSCVDDYKDVVSERFPDQSKLMQCKKAFASRWKARKQA